MVESIVTMSIAGILAGFLFSMPVAGPVSILITSNALKGRLRYCNLVNLGASAADFIYVFIAVFGLTKLYGYYKPAIPYILPFGSALLLFLGYKIFRTKIDIEHLEDKSHLSEAIKKREKGAFYTGFMINILNPTIFIGWFTSSFLIVSFISSLGLHTGGLASNIDKNVAIISQIEGKKLEIHENKVFKKLDNMQVRSEENQAKEQTAFPPKFHLVISICYALSISLGSIIWFYLLAYLIVRYRKRINIKIISLTVKGMGLTLCIIGLYFGYLAVKMIFT